MPILVVHILRVLFYPKASKELINIPAFMDATNLQPFINQELKGLITQIEYNDGKSKKVGYNALILPAH